MIKIMAEGYGYREEVSVAETLEDALFQLREYRLCMPEHRLWLEKESEESDASERSELLD
jgi:hypothetical protein